MRHTLLLTMLFALLGCSGTTKKDIPIEEEPLDSILTPSDNPSLRDDIGTMLMIGFRGTTIDSTSSIWHEIEDLHVGGVILFDYDAPTGKRGRNIQSPKQVEKLCAQLHALSPTLVIAIDQEGGSVSRLSSRYGFPSIPSAQATMKAGKDSVRHYASKTAKMLSETGININYAPVADVNVNPQCPVIGQIGRSFSANEKEVTDACRIWLEEQSKQGIIGCMKHFPGHGSASGDTHKGLVDVSDTWQRRELEPYRRLIAEGKVQMIMTAHVINRQMDPSGLPASLSPAITSYLRDTLGFKGVIITDDLAMGAISGQYSLEQTLKMALDAGADMLCLCNNGHEFRVNEATIAVRAIEKMVENGEISAERIHESAERIRNLVKQ